MQRATASSGDRRQHTRAEKGRHTPSSDAESADGSVAEVSNELSQFVGMKKEHMPFLTVPPVFVPHGMAEYKEREGNRPWWRPDVASRIHNSTLQDAYTDITGNIRLIEEAWKAFISGADDALESALTSLRCRLHDGANEYQELAYHNLNAFETARQRRLFGAQGSAHPFYTFHRAENAKLQAATPKSTKANAKGTEQLGDAPARRRRGGHGRRVANGNHQEEGPPQAASGAAEQPAAVPGRR
jgi:hypothetical protein